jgi:hypothetical protein
MKSYNIVQVQHIIRINVMSSHQLLFVVVVPLMMMMTPPLLANGECEHLFGARRGQSSFS